MVLSPLSFLKVGFFSLTLCNTSTRRRRWQRIEILMQLAASPVPFCTLLLLAEISFRCPSWISGRCLSGDLVDLGEGCVPALCLFVSNLTHTHANQVPHASTRITLARAQEKPGN